MKNKVIISFITILVYSSIIGQTNPIAVVPEKSFSELERSEFEKLLSNTFSKVVTGQSTASPGRYASLDIEKTEVNFAPSFVREGNDVVTLKFQGGITDGISSLFNNSKLNTNVSFELQYNLMLSQKETKVRYILDTYSEYKSSLNKRQKKILGELKEYYKKKEMDTTELKTIIDLLEQNSELIQPITVIKNLVKKDNFQDSKELGTINQLIDAQNEELGKFKFTGYSLNWITFGAKVKNDEFRLLNATESYENQITKTNYVSQGFSIQFSHYRYSENDNSLYYAIGSSFINKSNYLDLVKKTVKETSITGTSGTISRETSDTFIAYEGEYKKGIGQGNINTDIYYFLYKFENIGFHAFTNSKFTDRQKPQHNLGFGLVLPFIDHKKGQSIINAELYYNIKDIFNVSESDYSINQRNDIGLRFTFPINFNN